MRLCIQIADDDDLDDNLQQFFRTYVDDNIYGASAPGGSKIISRCMEAMQGVKSWLQKIADKVTAAGVFHGTDRPPLDDMLEYSRLSLLQQHEVLALITASAIDKRHSKAEDFKNLLKTLQKLDRYDHLLGMRLYQCSFFLTLTNENPASSPVSHHRNLYNSIWFVRRQQ